VQVRFYGVTKVAAEIEAATQEEAVAAAESRFEQCAAILAFASTPIKVPSCSVRVVKWFELSPNDGSILGEGRVKSLQFQGTRPVEVVGFDVMGRASSITALVDADPMVGELLEMWYRAEQVYPVASRPHDTRWALLDYARIIEHIANKLKPDEPADYGTLVDAIIKDMSTDLAKASGHRTRASAIHTAHEKIIAAKRAYTDDQITHAGQLLDVGPKPIEQAQATWKVRNSKAGHAKGGTITEDELYWARAAAAVYLAGYVQHVGRQKGDPYWGQAPKTK
jgi:hypothetical protein